MKCIFYLILVVILCGCISSLSETTTTTQPTLVVKPTMPSIVTSTKPTTTNPSVEFFCGDGICDAKEKKLASCPQDCKELSCTNECGDGECDYVICKKNPCPCLETKKNCPTDCGLEVEQNPVIKSVSVEGDPITIKSQGDLWLNTWADDDNIYTSWGDGTGFGKIETDFGIAKLFGNPPNLVGENIYNDPWLLEECDCSHCEERDKECFKSCSGPCNDKPSSLLFIDGRLYAYIHSPLGDPMVGYLAYSDDYGLTWTRLKDSSPWKASDKYANDGKSKIGSNFRCMFFINMGKNYNLNTDDYVYAFGIGREWGWYEGVYLARVPKNKILDYSSYTYFMGMQNNQPQWSFQESNAQPIAGLTTPAQFSSIYHPGIKRYIILTEENLYEALNPWGPWTLAGRWVKKGWRGYQPGIISKDTGDDYFWFTIAGQPSIGQDINYNLNIGKITMKLRD
ncbi:MAG: DUF4185 domain-containing protein [Candidatus Altiarchaeota archaeon]